MSKRKKSSVDITELISKEREDRSSTKATKENEDGCEIVPNGELSYNDSDSGPFVIHIEKWKDPNGNKESKEVNILKLDKLYSISFSESFKGAYGLRVTGFNRFKVVFINFHLANKFLKDFNKRAESIFKDGLWKVTIPLYKKAFTHIVHGIDDPEVTAQEVMDFLRPPPGWQGRWKNSFHTERLKKVVFTKEGKITKKECIDTDLFKVKFDWSGVPEKGVIWGLIVKIIPFVDKVRRCTHCQKFGHIKKFCRNKNKEPICGRCAEIGHDSDSCNTATRRCINCVRAKLEDLEHAADDNKCSLFKIQRDIKKVMVTRKLRPKEAISILEKNEGHPPPKPRSYAEATRINLGDLIKISKFTRHKKRAKVRDPTENKHKEETTLLVNSKCNSDSIEKGQAETSSPDGEMEIVPDIQEVITKEDEFLQEVLVNHVGSLVRETLCDFGVISYKCIIHWRSDNE